MLRRAGGSICGQPLKESTVPILEISVEYICSQEAVLLWSSVGCGDVPCLRGQL